MTEALTETQTEESTEISAISESIPTPQLEAYHYSDFFDGGKARHLYSAGISNRSWEPQMLVEGGLTIRCKHKKGEVETTFFVIYDKFYVFERECRNLSNLGIIKGGEIDKTGMAWFLNGVSEHAEDYAVRHKTSTLSAEELEAKRLAKKHPHLTWEEWLNVLKPKAEPEPTLETGKTPKTTASARSKKSI